MLFLCPVGRETTKLGFVTSLIELFILGSLLKISLSAKYRLDLFILIIPLLKSIFDHSSPTGLPSLTPVNILEMIATLCFISSAYNPLRTDIRVLPCSLSEDLLLSG